MKFPSTMRRSRSAVASAMLMGGSFAATANAPIDPWVPGVPQQIIVTRTAQELFDKGLLPDPNGQLVHERMPKGISATLNERLRQISLAKPFLPVGGIYFSEVSCTATWLGEDGGYTYLLTSAHCVQPVSAVANRVFAAFLGWHDRVMARDGWAFIPPSAVGRALEGPERAADIAVLKLSTVEHAVDHLGKPLEQPLLDDMGESNFEQPVHLVGYGNRQVHDVALGSGRGWGQTEIGATGYGLVELGLRMNSDSQWAGSLHGDSGSALWQSKFGYWGAIGVVSASTNHEYPQHRSSSWTVAALIANHIDWIRGIYPGVRTLSDRLSVKIGKPFISRGNEDLGVAGGVYFSVREKDGTRGGPLSGSMSDQADESVVHTTVLEQRTGNRVEVKLRTRRHHWCPDPKVMAKLCARLSKPLIVSFHAEDNPELQQGRWSGNIEVQVRRSVDNGIVDTLPIQLKLDHMYEGRVTVRQPYVAPMRLRQNAKEGSGREYHYAVQRQASVPLYYDHFLRISSAEHHRLLVVLRDMLGGPEQEVILRARQDMLCEGVLITRVVCPNTRKLRNDKLSISYHAEDNPKLPKGWYRGQFTLDSKPPSTSSGLGGSPYWPVDASALITVDIDTL